MKTKIEARLLEEAERFAFRFACEDCVYFVPAPGSPGRCAHGYPAAPLREELRPDAAEITFCKEFELR